MLLRGLWIVIFSFVFFFAIIGCSTQTQIQFVVLRDVPEFPSFVVIPANNYLNQVAFANAVEAAIISAGVKVVSRPATKEITKEVAVEGKIQTIEGNQAAHKSGEGKLIERYAEFADIEADYIVLTYANFRQIRIIKKQTAEILASIEVFFVTEAPVLRQQLVGVLKKIGVPVIYTHKQGSL